MASQEAMNIQEHIELINTVLPNVNVHDRPFYENMLSELYQRLSDQQRQSEIEVEALARAFQPDNNNVDNGVWGQVEQHDPTNYHSGPSYSNGASYGLQVPSPPLPELKQRRKRSLGSSDYPEAKRVSGQPSPVTPTSPVGPWSRSLPSRQSFPTRQSEPIPFVDLTESDPPSPERFELPARTYAQSDPIQHLFYEPFPELNAYQGDYENGIMASADAFNQEFMAPEELAEFLIGPSAPGGGYGYQQPTPHHQRARAGYPSPFMRGRDSDEDNYGSFPLNVDEAAAIEKLFENIKDDGENIEDREPTPKNMTCILKPYQRIGLTWLLKKERGSTKGGILADEMGLGKTIQALALICANPSTNPACKTTLIIAPVALMRQWEKEIERHVHPRHRLSVHLYHGSGKNADFARLRQFDVVLTTFGSLTSEFKQRESSKEAMLNDQELRNPNMRRKAKDRLALLGQECMWYRIVIDEAHNIKNRNSKSSKACADLMAKHRLCMTGTPMMNSVDELFPLLRFLKAEPYCNWTKFSLEIAKVSAE
jgi:hypothetical protein